MNSSYFKYSCGVSTCFLAALAEVQAQERPNIIVILADDMGYSDIGCMGSEIKTPNLDRLAQHGQLFTHCYNTSRSCPSRASLLTGMYQHKAGVGAMIHNLGYPSYQGYLNDHCLTIAEEMQRANYRTIMVGKWHVGNEPETWPERRGFERTYSIPRGGGLYFYPSKFLDRPVYKDGKKAVLDSTFYSTNQFTDEAMEYISEATKDKVPFFMYLAYIAPHYPLQALDKDIAKYKHKYDQGYEATRNARFAKQKALGIVGKDVRISDPFTPIEKQRDKKAEARKMEVYAAQIDCMDQNIGRLVAHLDSIGQLDNTVLIFLADNGGCAEEVNKDPSAVIGSRNSFVSYGKAWANVSNTPYREYKQFVHEGGILTPLIIHWPAGIRKSNRMNNTPIHIMDILPTCLELAGAEHPKIYKGKQINSLDGQSILPLLNSESHAFTERVLCWEHMGNTAIRKGVWKLVKKNTTDWELYNLKEDPTELNNLADSKPEIVKDLKTRWKEWTEENQVKSWPINKKQGNKS